MGGEARVSRSVESYPEEEDGRLVEVETVCLDFPARAAGFWVASLLF